MKGFELTWVQRLALAFYGLLMVALIPLLRLKLKRRGDKEPGYLHHREQRLGHYPHISNTSGAVWVHAVSLGETRAAAILLRALRQREPGIRILLTHGTATGWAEGAGLLQSGDMQVWQPWDTPWVLHRFLQHFQPRMGILLETEVWPHWVHACSKAGVPLHLVNARLSEKSLRKALRQSWLARPAYGRLSSVLPQSTEDAQRFAHLGARLQSVMGNLKYDVTIDTRLQALGLRWRAAAKRPIVMLASSRDGEELLWMQVLRHLGEDAQRVQWLVVPRHPHRFDGVAQLIEQSGWLVSRRSQWAADSPPASVSNQVWLGDSLGEMQAYFHLASVAWLGGSFAPFGGQNLIEAAACACPVVMGPHTFNFSEAAQQAEKFGAAVRVDQMVQAWTPSLQWLTHPEQAQAARFAASQWLAHAQGAAQRCADLLLSDSTP